MVLVLLAALAVLTTWLDFEVRNSMTEAASRNRHDPDTILHDFTTEQTGRAGSVETIVKARTMRRYMDDGASEFERPQVRHRDAKGVLLDIASERGHASGDQSLLEFDGAVKLRHGGNGKTPVTLETTYLKVMPQQNLASTDRAVRIRSADTLVTGVGLDFDLTAQTTRLRSRVKVTYLPPKAHAADIKPTTPVRSARDPARSAAR